MDTQRAGLAKVGVRELRANVAALVRRASTGERIVVTSDGVPVAVLGPLQPGGSGVSLDDLIAAGLLTPPGSGRPEAPEPVSLPVDTRSGRVLDDLRGA
ncbi:MAG TPA: type II toxin-antitoxin system prevent-host-death family antitoxin [Acidimicrobiales bacterium]|nr:type II toxin-antitoxin system prevent-host-death family antitoxin [Acidimicrobiales bacterium]